MQDLLESLERSIVDAQLTTVEKHQLAAALRARPWRPDQLRQFRNHAFELVLEHARRPELSASMPQLVEWLADVVRVLDQVMSPVELQTEVWFSPGLECRSALLSYLLAAKKRIDICVFTIADDDISAAIVAAHDRGLAVRIISDNDKRFDSGSDIRRIQAAGIPVVVDESEAHMHHKFVIFDQRWLLNGSFNWTRSASSVNEENLVATNDPQQVRRFSAQFERLWERYSGTL